MNYQAVYDRISSLAEAVRLRLRDGRDVEAALHNEREDEELDAAGRNATMLCDVMAILPAGVKLRTTEPVTVTRADGTVQEGSFVSVRHNGVLFRGTVQVRP